MIPLTNPLAVELLRRIRQSDIRAGVIGLGYVGLPLAVELARAGYSVVGLDIDERKVDAIERGTSYIPDVQSVHLAELVAADRLRATNDFAALKRLDTVNICVPTPLRKTKDPDVSYMVAAVEQVAKYLHPGMLVILESTTYPGTTEELIRPMLEATGLKAGRDFFLAFSPERVDPGNAQFHTANVPKVVGWHDRDLHVARVRALPGSHRASRHRRIYAGGGDGEAAREHVPCGQHRSRQRDCDDVRHPWH